MRFHGELCKISIKTKLYSFLEQIFFPDETNVQSKRRNYWLPGSVVGMAMTANWPKQSFQSDGTVLNLFQLGWLPDCRFTKVH
jgi:hypothetical protein